MDYLSYMYIKKFLEASYSPEENSDFEIRLRKSLHQIFQGNFVEAVQNLKDHSPASTELRHFARILEGLAYYSDNRLYQAAMHMNVFVETLPPEENVVFRILRDFYLARAGKDLKDIYDEWSNYCSARYKKVYNDDGSYVPEVKDTSVKEPHWIAKN